MANLITAPFTGGGAFPVDARLEKTKAEMLATNDNVMPENYFALCDGQLYLYKKSNTVDPETGKYRLFEGGGGTGDYSDLTNKPKLNGVTIEGDQTSEDFGLADADSVYTKEEADALLGDKADASEVYTKTEVDALIPDVSDFVTDAEMATALDAKADKSTTYTKTEVDALIPDTSDFVTDSELTDALANKADAANTYTKAEVDALIPDVSDFATETELTDGLATKADAATTYTKAEVDALIPDVSDFVTDTELATALGEKADKSTTYTKTETDALLDAKADASSVYTKTETDTLLDDKADASAVYTKTEVDAELDLKADKSDTYTKTEVDALIPGSEVLVAVYEQTSYADVRAAIDAHKAILLDMPANNNQFCITFSTYTNGGNALMYAIYKMSDKPTLMTVTLTPQDQWRISHTELQDKLESGTSIKTINGESLLGSGNIDIQGGSGNASLELDKENNEANLSNQFQHLAFDFGNDEVEVVAADPGTYYNSKVLPTKGYVDTELAGKQNTLVSGTNIKTINNESLLGSGNINIEGGNTPTVYWDDATFSYGEQGGDSFTLSCDQNTDREVYFTFRSPDPDADQKKYTVPTQIITNNLQKQIDTRVGTHFAVGQEKWYGTYTDENNVTYQVYTKTVYIPSLPNAAGITTYQIGVSGMKQILNISGVTTDGFALNAPRQSAADNISIYQVSKGSQTFSIEVGKDRSSKSAYVTIIYAKNN